MDPVFGGLTQAQMLEHMRTMHNSMQRMQAELEKRPAQPTPTLYSEQAAQRLEPVMYKSGTRPPMDAEDASFSGWQERAISAVSTRTTDSAGAAPSTVNPISAGASTLPGQLMETFGHHQGQVFYHDYQSAIPDNVVSSTTPFSSGTVGINVSAVNTTAIIGPSIPDANAFSMAQHWHSTPQFSWMMPAAIPASQSTGGHSTGIVQPQSLQPSTANTTDSMQIPLSVGRLDQSTLPQPVQPGYPPSQPTIPGTAFPPPYPTWPVRYPAGHYYPPPCPYPTQTRQRTRKAMSYPKYEENSDPDAHIIAFKRVLKANREDDDEEKINLFGTTLTKGPQKWHDRFLRDNPRATWEQLAKQFCLRYRKEQTDEQIYAAIKQMKQGSNEKVQEYYERFTGLIDNLSSPPGEGFVMTNFRTGLTDSLQYALSSHEFDNMNQLKAAAVNTNVRPIRHSSNSRDNFPIPSGQEYKPDPCSICGRGNHATSDCYFNPTNSKNRTYKPAESKEVAGVHAVITQPAANLRSTGEARPSYPRPNRVQPRPSLQDMTCYCCGSKGHLARNCSKNVLWQQYQAKQSQSNQQKKPDVHCSAVLVEATDASTHEIATIAVVTGPSSNTRSRTKPANVLTDREPRKATTKEDWQREEQIRNSLYEELEKIHQDEIESRSKELTPTPDLNSNSRADRAELPTTSGQPEPLIQNSTPGAVRPLHDH